MAVIKKIKETNNGGCVEVLLLFATYCSIREKGNFLHMHICVLLKKQNISQRQRQCIAEELMKPFLKRRWYFTQIVMCHV